MQKKTALQKKKKKNILIAAFGPSILLDTSKVVWQ